MTDTKVLKDGTKVVVEQLTMDDIKKILTLQQKVTDTLTTKSFLAVLTEDDLENVLQGNGQLIGAFVKDRLIAFRAMLVPEFDEEHLGKDAGLDRSEWPQVIYQEISNVDPDFRGNGLQQYLGRILMRQVDTNRFKYVCATVAPFNIASLKDKFSHGLEIVALNEKYGGMLRYTLMKVLTEDDDAQALENQTVYMGETEAQQELLKDGWIGTAIKEIDGQWMVHYDRRK